jgi:hypothetical protein
MFIDDIIRQVRRVYEPNREELAGGWRRLHNEELHNFKLHQILLWIMSRRM